MQNINFFSEWLAAGRLDNQITISSLCNVQCLFCSSTTNPFPVINNKFRDIEDIKKQLVLMHVGNQEIRLGDSLPGRVAEGEALLHPQLFTILDLIRKRFPLNVIQIITNGTRLTEDFIARLKTYRPLRIALSLHSQNPEYWMKIYGKKSPRMASIAINSPKLIKKNQIKFEALMVLLPKICGWKDIDETFEYLVRYGAEEIVLWKPGYTIITPKSIRDEIACDDEEFYDFAHSKQEKYPELKIIILPPRKFELEFSIDKIMKATQSGNIKNLGGAYCTVLWLSSVAGFEKIKQAVEEKLNTVPNTHLIKKVSNRVYGGNIIVGGLLFVEDFIQAGKEALAVHPEIELILIPNTPFDSLLQDLKKRSVYEISDALDRPVWMVTRESKINPLLSPVFHRKS